MVDYEYCTVNGLPAVEIFDPRTGCPIAIEIVPLGMSQARFADVLCRGYEAGRIKPAAIVCEVIPCRG